MAKSNLTKGILPVVVGVLSVTGASAAEENESANGGDAAAASASDNSVEEVAEVVVTGFRASLKTAVELKKNSDVMMDAINAEDIADFPDANLAESLQRLPGIALDRDNGEGRGITVRGLSSDFTRVRINGLETMSNAGASDSGAAPNRGRGFDFNVFASDLFTSLQVRKSASASTDEGSLGATVDLITGKPLDYKGRKIAFSVEDAYYENGKTHNPRLAGLYADQWLDNTIGASFSFAYSERDSEVDRYKRQQGQSDYAYRSSSWNGNETPQRAGFAAPTGTTFPTNIFNPMAAPIPYDAMTGSNPAAYAALYPAGLSTAGRFDDNRVLIPSLLNIEQQDLVQERLGLTGAFQWNPTDTTRISLDGVYSKFDQKSDVNQIQSVGLNRNNTSGPYQIGTLANTTALARRNTYQTCADQAALPYRDAIDCGGASAMPGGVFPGLGTTSFSTNPHNLETYDYYNNPASPGYPGAAAVQAANGYYFRDRFIGRPGVEVLAANVSPEGVADYLELRGIDWRSATDSSYFTTEFRQGSISFEQDIGDQLTVDVLYGKSRSVNDNQAFLVEFNRMDSPETFIYDERAGGSMPSISYGFDLADPNQWSLVKGFSVLRHFLRETINDYEGGHIDFDVKLTENVGIELGYTRRVYRFAANEARRNSNEQINPTLAELGVTAQDLGRVYNFGQGLDVPAGAPSAFFAPDIDKFREVIGFDCNCLHENGDFRLSYLSNPGNQFKVDEYDTSYFLQVNYDFDLAGHRLFGNVGQRIADTRLKSTGYTTNVAATGPRPIYETNRYSDDLPSLNIAYEITDNLLVRGAWSKVMARAQLANLAPTITAITTPSAPSTTTGSMTIGNPQLMPFRSENLDLSVEWYFGEGGLVSLAVFKKDVTNYPQTVSSSATLEEILTPEQYAATLETQTAAQRAWITGFAGNPPGLYAVRQFQDSPGGEIKGWEFSYQQNLTFLPGFLKNFGVQANYTHLDSELNYIVDPGQTVAPISPATYALGPFTGASPESANFTLYYETPKWSARASWAYRDAYVSTYPLAAGTCPPGLNPTTTPLVPCDAPLMNDFVGSAATRNIDASVRWQATDSLSLSLEALNITNQTEDRWAYQADPVVTQYSSTGRQLFVGARFTIQ